jgi:molybdate transport system substrate-binding protein
MKAFKYFDLPLVCLALVAAVVWMILKPVNPSGVRSLIVYAAPAVRVPLERIAADYEAETGRKVELRFGPSETILTQAGMVNPAAPGDLFFPADSSYVDAARDRGMVAEAFPIATMRVVVLTAPGNPKKITEWNDLLRQGVKVAVPNPGAAVGKVARNHLTKTGKWNALSLRVVDTGTVTEAANSAKLGAVDAAIVWDAVAGGYKDQTVLKLPEFDGVTARVDLAILKQSAVPAEAKRLAEFIVGEKGIQRFREAGFNVTPILEGTK